MGKNISYYKNTFLSGKINRDVDTIKEILKFDAMLRIRKTFIGKTGVACAAIFIDGMVSSDLISDHILRALVTADTDENFKANAESVAENLLYSSEVKSAKTVAEMLSAVFYGDTVLLVDGDTTALVINTKGWRFRSIEEPPNERILTGPREGFDEAALLNLAQIRRRLQTPDLCICPINLGLRTDTKVFVCYLGSLADNELVKAVKEKINAVNIDGVLDINYIAEEICGKDFLFKTTGKTERPDIAVARMLEGRIVIIADGSPVVLTLPYLFSENFQSNEDYYQNWILGSAARIIRFISFAASCFAPAIYISLVSFHAGFLPTFSALSVLKLRTGVPISSLLECIILILVLELLKEACLRAPKDIGAALSIIGGLVLGEAAVETRIISASALIVVALSGLCSAMLPRLRLSILFINFFTSILAGFFGLIGTFTGICVTAIYILGLESFGYDYTLSLNKLSYQNLKDVLIRAKWTDMIFRPDITKDIKRQNNDIKR